MYILLLCIQYLSSIVGGQIPVPPFIEEQSRCPPSCNNITQPCDCYHDGWVDCARKNLKSIPATLPECVRNLEVRQNGITELAKEDFQGLTSLFELMIVFEPIKVLGPRLFSSLPNLLTLNMSSNHINAIAEYTFEGLFSLERLLLHSNNLTYLPSHAFEGMPNLYELDLMNNHIMSIAANSFGGLVNLRILNLVQNNISTLNTGWFLDKRNLTRTFVTNNKWNCTCSLKQTYDLLQEQPNIEAFCTKFLDLFCIQCITPSTLAGRNLVDIAYSEFPSCGPLSTITTIPVTQSSTRKAVVALTSILPLTKNLGLPLWLIVVIILLLLVAVIPTTIFAMWYVRRSKHRATCEINGNCHRNELERSNFSSTSYEKEKH